LFQGAHWGLHESRTLAVVPSIRLLQHPRATQAAVLGCALGLLAAIALALTARQQAERIDQQATLSRSRAAELGASLTAMLDAETGQRGYVITGAERYLQPFRGAAVRAQASLAQLRALYAGEPAVLQDLQRLEALEHEKLVELQEVIDTRRTGDGDAARSIVMNDRGRRTMDQIRELLQQLQRREDGRIAVLTAEGAARRLHQSVAQAGVLGLVAALALLAYRQLVGQSRRAARSERRLRGITDNVPAFISHIDREGRYTFVSGHFRRLDMEPEAMVGRSLYEARDAHYIAQAEPHIASALAGREVCFDAQLQVRGEMLDFQQHFVPDFDERGEVQGFYSVTIDVTETRRYERMLQELTQVDTLTGLANRRRFESVLPEAMARARRSRRPMALLFLDLDRFKAVNDTHGHAVGDEVLKALAARLRACVRATDTVARLAGDEFVVVLEGLNAGQEAHQVAAKIIEAMHLPIETEVGPLHLSTSIGVAIDRGEEATRPEALLHKADKALYAAKGAGRDTFSATEL
jgi:diguanylate cyclase (GGDEF)-like protein/PAS domain S-box-containing protein